MITLSITIAKLKSGVSGVVAFFRWVLKGIIRQYSKVILRQGVDYTMIKKCGLRLLQALWQGVFDMATSYNVRGASLQKLFLSRQKYSLTILLRNGKCNHLKHKSSRNPERKEVKERKKGNGYHRSKYVNASIIGI